MLSHMHGGIREVQCPIKQLPQKVGLASAISWYFLSHQLRNILRKHCWLIMVSDIMLVECYRNPFCITSFPEEEIVDLFLVWWVRCHYIYQTQTFRRCTGHENPLFCLWWCCQGRESNMEKPETAINTEVGTVQKLSVQVVGRLNGREGMQGAILSLLFPLTLSRLWFLMTVCNSVLYAGH